MNPFAISGLLIFVTCAVMANWLYSNNRSNHIARFWAIFCLAVATWGFGGFFIGQAADSTTALLWWRIAYVGVIFIPVLFYHFVLQFLGLRRQKTLKLLYFVTGGFLLADVTPFFIAHVRYVFGQFYYLSEPGPLYSYFVLFFVGIIFLAHVDLWKFMRKTTYMARRVQVRWFFLATALGFLGGATCYLPVFGINLYPYGNFAVPLYPVIMGYAIVRHQLMDIRVVIRRSVVYSALISTMTLTYFTGVFISEKYFQAMLGYRSLIFSVVLFTVMALIFQPMKNWLQAKVDQWLLPESKEALTRRLELLQEEIQQADKARAVGQLAAGIAHEIKNPLTAMKTYIDYFREKRTDPKFMDQFYDVLKEEITHLHDLTQGLVSFSKPSVPSRQCVDLQEILQGVLSLSRAELERNRIQLQTVYSRDGIPLQADPDHLRQVFMNLVLNAKDAMPNGGKLSITTKSSEQSVEIVISDTGCGIQPKDLPHIFDPFFTRKTNGNGLGLSIVHRIIQEHGGSIQVTSQANHGTTFTIRLPAQVKV